MKECMEVEGAMTEGLVSIQDVKNILDCFKKTTYKPHEGKTVANEALSKCLELFKIDYAMIALENLNAELSTNYPGIIPIPEHELNQSQGLSQKSTDTIYENSLDGQRLQELSHRARLARCRGRFPVPVILCKGKYICRSSTLSGGPEMYGRSSYDFLFNSYESNQKGKATNSTEASNYENFTVASTSSSPPTEIPPQKPGELQLFDRVRNSDITLLKSYNIGTIVDLMVEKKKVKYGFHVTSSEKVDKENRYNQFVIISLPYPGCEFFKEYRDNNYEGSGLTFNWGQSFIDAQLNVSEDVIPPNLNIAWDEYTTWDLETITKNYLKFLLKYFNEKDSGLLVHCISGWDRTPLFISLLRLSLWADGLIHQTLDPQQILYLTIAYDWFLFGHHLNDRLTKGEDIFFFCFNVIKHLMSDDYSLQQPGRKAKVSDKPTRTDLDSILEPIMLECDIRGSNISLNSISSSVSNKSHDFFYTYVHNFEDVSNISNGNQVLVNADPDFNPARSPQSNGNQFTMMECCPHSPKSPQSNGNESIHELDTSPVKSPNSQRTSPVTVPDTKLRTRQESSSSLSLSSWHLISGTGSIRDGDSSDNNGLNANSDCASIISGHTIIDDPDAMDPIYDRGTRLKRVRELFFSAYPTTVGFRTNEEQNSFGQILGNIAEKVGLSGGK